MNPLMTSIELRDNFSGVLHQVINSVNLGLSAMEDFQRTMDKPMDTTSMDAARNAINQATMAVQELDAAMQDVDSISMPTVPVKLPIEPVVPNPLVDPQTPVKIPVDWQTDSLDVFTNTGIARFKQEIQSAHDMLVDLSFTQKEIAETAAQTSVFPKGMASDLNNIGNRMQAIQTQMQKIEKNKLNIGAASANAELEQLRGQLNQAVQEQEQLNHAVDIMDVRSANAAYLRLSQTIGNTERYIRDNVNAQGEFNQKINEGASGADGLMGKIKGIGIAYAAVQIGKKAINLSDTLASTTARLDMMNDGLQTTEELQNDVFQSAERSRGSYQATADAVSKLGLMAGDAFGSSQEIIAFMEQVNKQFKIAGTSAEGMDAAMLQLTQAMGSGVLRGEEYNSILEQSPNIIQAIADYMDVPMGKLKDMASNGEITAEIVKNALFAAADETNAKFEQMPRTLSDIWDSIKNNALMAFQPILQKINEIANSQTFQRFVNHVITGIASIANIAAKVFDFLVSTANIIIENWSWISPVIYGVAGALAVYYGWQVVSNVVSLISKGIHFAVAAAQVAHAIATKTLTTAKVASIAAQNGLNVAMLACPITWIVLGIAAIVAIVIAACKWISKLTGWTKSGFGLICGAVNVGIQFFKNLGLSVANVALGIWEAMDAVGENIKTVFTNTFHELESWFWGFLSTVMNVVDGICWALNKIPFVEFDYQGVTDKANEFAQKADAAHNNKKEYVSISDAWDKGYNTFKTFESGWVSDAFNAGSKWGDGVVDTVKNWLGFGKDQVKKVDIPAYDNLYANVQDINDNTTKMADSLSVSETELKYLREIAERQAINKFTTAEIKLEMHNTNTISGDQDIDGIIEEIQVRATEALAHASEGVHI